MAAIPTMSVSPAAITSGIAIAEATHYIIPSVDQIFNAGVPSDQIPPEQMFNGTNFGPGIFAPIAFNGLYYNLSFLWPQLQETGIIFPPGKECTPLVCSLLLGNFLYLPNIPANTLFTVLFAIAIVANTGLGIWQRTWGFMVGMLLGLLCEILGYIGRILISQNDFTSTPFYIYIICLTIGPAFLSFSVYTCLARIVVVYGKNLSRFKPKTYTYIFVACDFVSLVLQAAGGGLASSGGNSDIRQTGINTMIGGLAFQVTSLTIFILLCGDYFIRVYRHRQDIDPTYQHIRSSRFFTGFLVTLGIATLTIYIRSVFRVAELQQGFKSRFANDEVTFMVLEASMITIAVASLTAFHPAIVFGVQWREITQLVGGKAAPAGKIQESYSMASFREPSAP